MKWLCGCVLAVYLSGSLFAAGKDSVATLIKELKDKDDLVRLKAAKSLGKLGAAGKEAIPALTEALKDPDDDVRVVAKQALARIKEAVAKAAKEEAFKRLTTLLGDVRSTNRGGQAKAVLGLVDLLKNEDEVIRVKAARGLGESGAAGKSALKGLDVAARDSDELVRREARRAITNIQAAIKEEKRVAALAKLAPLLKDLRTGRTVTIRLKSLEKIGDLGEDGVWASEALLSALADRSPVIRKAALETLEKANPLLYKPILTILVDENPENKREAIKQLGKMEGDGKPAIDFLIRLYHIQATYDEATGSHHYYSLDLWDALKGIDPDNKKFLELVLNSLPVSRTSVRPGTTFIGDSVVRQKGITMVLDFVKDKKIKPARAVKPLVQALVDPTCRIQAINALGDLGVEAKDAIPVLKKMKTDPDKTTRDAVMEALKKIE